MQNKPMERVLNTDVCVIGGGPAGAVTAQRLSIFGHSVLLLEKEAFPRPHVGICLSVQTDALLKYIGVEERIKQEAFARRRKTLIQWSSEQAIVTEQPGYHVDRGRFDEILIQNAEQQGVQVLQPARSTSITRCSTAGWKIKSVHQGHKLTIQARFLVDASGRAHALVGKRNRYTLPLFALHTVWTLKSTPHHDGIMEAGKKAWLWTARLNNRRTMVSLYTDPADISQGTHRDLEEYFYSSLRDFSLIKNLIPDSVSPVHGCDASSRYAQEPIGSDFIRVGDANYTVDPMAAQGVHLALSSAVQASIVVNTLLRYPRHASAAQRFYQDRQQERIQQFRERTAREYARVAAYRPQAFWQKRGQEAMTELHTQSSKSVQLSTTQKFSLCPQAKIIDTPILQDQWVEYAPALHHPSLDRPVAFLAGIKLAPLFHPLRGELTINKVIRRWNNQVSSQHATQIIQWLWGKNILIPAG